MREAIGGTRAAFMRMLDAHIALLRAELQIAGRELGIIVGLALAALFVAILVLILLYVGAFLFFGEWLFGSMGWGIIHGTLVGAAVIGYVAVDLAGGDARRYGWGALVGAIVTVVIAVLLLSNVGNEGGEWARRFLQDEFVTEDLPFFGEEWLVTLSGLVVGGIIGTVVALIGGWRGDQRGRALIGLGAVGFLVGGFIGAIYSSTRYQAPDGVLGLAIMIGLLTWIIAGLALAYRAGFDAESRWAKLLPRESFAAFEESRDFLKKQWGKQKDRMMGR